MAQSDSQSVSVPDYEVGAVSRFDLTKSIRLSTKWPKEVEGRITLDFSNFPYDSLAFGKAVAIPKFELLGHEWEISIYPGGNREQKREWTSFSMRYLGETEPVTATWSIYLLNADGEQIKQISNAKEHKWNPGHAYTKPAFIREDMRLRCPEGNFSLDLSMKILPAAEIPVTNCTSRVAMQLSEIGRSVAARSQSIAEDFAKLYENKKFTDVTFVVGSNRQVKFEAHRAVITARCPVPILHEEMLEHKPGATVHIPDVEPEAFQEFLRFLYTDEVGEEALNEMADSLLIVADKYGVSRLQAICEESLERRLTVDNVCEMRALAETRNAKWLSNACAAFVNANAAEVLDTQGFKTISQEMPHIAISLFKAYVEGMTAGTKRGLEDSQDKAKSAKRPRVGGGPRASSPSSDDVLDPQG